MAPRPGREWSSALSHLALGSVSLYAALSTAQVSTLGPGRGVAHSQIPRGWWEVSVGARLL